MKLRLPEGVRQQDRRHDWKPDQGLDIPLGFSMELVRIKLLSTRRSRQTEYQETVITGPVSEAVDYIPALRRHARPSGHFRHIGADGRGSS